MNSNVTRPFQKGDQEADQELLLQALGPKGNNLLILPGDEGLGGRCEGNGVYWQERRALG